MSDEEISHKDNPRRGNFKKFKTILTERTAKEKETEKKKVEKTNLNNLETNNKVIAKDINNSYQSAVPSKNDPSLFKFDYEGIKDHKEDSSIEDMMDNLKFNKEKNQKEESSNDRKNKVKKIEINKNLVEDIRKKKIEEAEKDRMKKIKEMQLEEEKLKKDKLANEKLKKNKLDEEKSKKAKLEEEKLKKAILEEEKLRNDIEEKQHTVINTRDNNNTFDSLIQYKEKENIFEIEKNLEEKIKFKNTRDQIDLMNNLKNKEYKDEMPDLLEKSFDNHFNLVRETTDEKIKTNKLIEEFENSRNLIEESKSKMTKLDHLSYGDEVKSKKSKGEINDETFSNYSDYEIRLMHFDGYNRFYKSDFYYDQLFREEEEENDLKIFNKDSLLFKSRLIYNYFNEKTNISLPKFAMQSEKERKCQEILQVGPKSVEEQTYNYYDRFWCLNARKKYFRYTSHISSWCYYIVKNPIFDNISISVILINTLLIFISDNIANSTDNYFLYLYSVEMFLKIFAYGFVLSEGAYIKDLWNIIDFTVIVVGWISFILQNALSGNKISGLSGLRAFRILRPLKTIKSIKGLKSLVVTLIKSVIALSDIAIVVFFFMLIFAIAGVQMWNGLFLRRCMSLDYGYFYDFSNYTTMCTIDDDCNLYNRPGNTFICAKSSNNPNNDVTSYDNIISGLITVYIILTMEGWTDIWNYVSKTFKDSFHINTVIIFLYFFILLFVGGYYLINLFLAVIKTQFTKISNDSKEKEVIKKNFFQLIKEKYNLESPKEEIKVVVKRRDVINEEEALRKLKSQTVFFKRNEADIPIDYNTLNDILCMKTMKPVELDNLKKKISREEEAIMDEFNKKKENILKLAAKSKLLAKDLENLQRSFTIRRYSTKLVKATSLDKKKEDSIKPVTKKFLLESVAETLAKFENEFRNNLKRKKEMEILPMEEKMNNDNKKKNLNKPKKDPKKKVLNVSIKDDVSFEIEMNNKNKILENVNSNNPNDGSQIFHMNLGSSTYAATNLTKTMDKSNIHAHKNRLLAESNKRHLINNIEDEISFFSDNTDDDIEDELKLELDYKNIGQYYSNQINSNNVIKIKDSLFSSIPQLNLAIEKTLLANKKYIVDPKNSITQGISFKRPNSLLSTIFKFKDEIDWKKKLEVKRKHFKLDYYLSQLKPHELNALGKRRSFLNTLQYVEGKYHTEENYNFNYSNKANTTEQNFEEKSLEVSLVNEDDLMLDDKSLSDFDMVPSAIENEDKYIQQELDFEEINKKEANIKFERIARNSMFDNTKRNSVVMSYSQSDAFYNKINSKLSENIVIDMKEPKRGLQTNLTVNDHLATKNNKNSDNSIKRTQQHEFDHYKAKSVEKNYLKYPKLTNREIKLNEKKKNPIESALIDRKKQIPLHQQDKRRQLNYTYNIYDKDFKIQDKFNADYWRDDVLGPKEKDYEQIKKPEEINPIYIFNDSSLNLKTYSYQKYKKFEILDDEYINQNHKLKYLGANVIEIFPPKQKYFGMVKSEKIKQSATSANLSIRPLSKSNFNSKYLKSNPSLQKSKSIIGHSTINSVKHGLINDWFKVKKTLIDKVHKKINNFNYKTLSHYFLQDERLSNKIQPNNDKKNLLSGQLVGMNDALEVRQQMEKIRIYDIETNSRKYILWSGEQVLNLSDETSLYDEWNEILGRLEEFDVILWKKGCLGVLQKIRYGFYYLSISQFIDYFIITMVLLNAVTMALDGNLLDPDTYYNIQLSNYGFNGIFIAEFLVKFLGLGPILYFSDPFTYLDVFIIAFAILDMATPDGAQTSGADLKISSQLAFLRVFRIFRVLRLAKVLRKFKAMRKIFKGISKSMSNVSYIILILVIFQLIFQLLGMSLINGTPYFDGFLPSFYSTFQILTVENWNTMLYDLSLTSRLTVLYMVVWIFLGNYILFNLFISVLLDSFEGDEEEDDEEELDEYQKKIRTILPQIFEKYEIADKEHKNRINKKRSDNSNKYEKKNDESNTSINSAKNLSKSISQDASRSYNDNSGDEANQEENKFEDDDEEEDQTNLSIVARMTKKWEKENRIFKRNDCEWSLFIFSQTNTFRILMMKLAQNKKFDNLILVMILCSTLRLILDTFLTGYLSELIFDMVDICFVMIFLFEAVVKIIASGFVIDHGSYLRDNWNKIDFIIVTVSIVDFEVIIGKYMGALRKGSLSYLRVLRLLRLLRPLRFISHNVQLKLIITSLFDSMIPILNVLLVVLVVFFIFSIVGMNVFYDYYNTCYKVTSTGFSGIQSEFNEALLKKNITQTDLIATHQLCQDMGGIMYAAPRYKFSNLITSLVTCYVLSNMEGWPDIMNSYRKFNDLIGLFFIGYLIIVSYFFLNLFVGIMFNCFNKAWSKEKTKGISNNYAAEKYWDWLKQIEFAKPEYETYKVPIDGYRVYLHKFSSSKFLDNFIMSIILMNLILMAMMFEGSGDSYNSVLDSINLAFTSIFICECFIKLLAFGFQGYFYHGWNQFDFFVVASSIVDITVTNSTSSNSAFLKSFQIIRVLRVLRVTRVLRLVKSLKSLEKLLQTLRWSMTALSNIFILMFLIFCIFAIAGCYLYESIKYKDYQNSFVQINEYYNFDNFYNSFNFCLRAVTGENWPDMMVELSNVNPKLVDEVTAIIYMITMNFVSNVIMINLFVLVTLQQYDEFVNKKENPIEKFNELLVSFKNSWNKFSTDDDNGYKIKYTLSHDFLMDLDWDQISYKKKVEDVKIYLMDLDLLRDQNYIYFHDVLFKLVKREIGGRVETKIDIITNEEERLNKYIQVQIYRYIREHEQGMTKVSNPLNKFNPLTSHLYYKTSYVFFKTILDNYNSVNKKYIAKIKENAQDNMSEEDDSQSNLDTDRLKNDKNIEKKVFVLEDNAVNLNQEITKKVSLELVQFNISDPIKIEANNSNNIKVVNEDSNRSQEKLIIRENIF